MVHVAGVQEIVSTGEQELFALKILKRNDRFSVHLSLSQPPGTGKAAALRCHHVPVVVFTLIDDLARDQKFMRFVVDDCVTARVK